MQQYRTAYGEAGQQLSDSQIMDEMAADFTETLMEDNDLFARFAYENRSTAQKMLDALRELIAKIRAHFSGAARDAAAQEATGKTLGELEQIAEQWQSAFSAAQAQNKNTATPSGSGVRYSFKGYDKETGKGIYQSAFPLGTPKAAKAAVILDYIQNVWSKKPITLVVGKGKNARTIQAQFDPYYDESGNTPTDASKLMGGTVTEHQKINA